MNLLDYTNAWVKGEVLQGKIMLAIAFLIIVAVTSILKSDHELLKGMVIPLVMVIIGVGGYGGFQSFGRLAHIEKVKLVMIYE